MTGPVSLNAPITIDSGGVKIRGPSILTTTLDFTGVNQTYVLDLTLAQQGLVFGPARSIYANNSQNPNPLLITIQGTGSNIVIPALSIGLLPISALMNSKIQVFSVGGAVAGSMVEFELYNYERPPYVYTSAAPLVAGAQVEALAQTANTIIGRNTSLTAGVSTNVFPNVSNVRQVLFQNIGDAAGNANDVWWNIGITATGSFAAGDQYMLAGDPKSFLLMPFRTAQRISFFSANGTRIQAMEWNT